MTLTGRAWVCSDYTDSYKILPQKYWIGGEQIGKLNMDELAPHVMEDVDPAFAAQAKQGTYAFVVAGAAFGGGGKSIEHPIYAIKGAGVKAVIAESVARYFFRNSINNGLPILICKGITSMVKTGDELKVDISNGVIHNTTNGATLKALPLPAIGLEIIGKGGYIKYTQERLGKVK